MISGRDFHAAVGVRLRTLRLAFGKSQSDFAKTLGVGATAISNYEVGARAVDPYDAFKLKNVYGAPLEWLYSGDVSSLPGHLAEKLDQPAKQRGVSGAHEPRSRRAAPAHRQTVAPGKSRARRP